jgi:hypothetical protein
LPAFPPVPVRRTRSEKGKARKGTRRLQEVLKVKESPYRNRIQKGEEEYKALWRGQQDE